jgi:lactate permease
VLYVIWPALILYNVAAEAGAFVAMQRGIRRLMPDRLLVVLAFAWVLSSFIQSIAGFGTPLAVTVPLLIGLGVKPAYAVLLPMVGAAWGNMFGSLGVTWFATLTVVDLENATRALRYTAGLLWIPNLLAGLAIAWFYGRAWALRRGGPAILVISLLHGGLQLLLVPLLPTIGNLLAAAAGLGATFLLNRWDFYRQEDEDEPNLIFEEWAYIGAGYEEPAPVEDEVEDPDRPQPMSLLLAFVPYAVLTGLAIVTLLVPPITRFLESVQVGLPFPETTTGYLVRREAVTSYAAFTPLTHPGTLLLISAAAGYLLYRSRGYYTGEESVGLIVRQAAEEALPATTAVTALLLISKVMDHTGEITVLALGVSQVAPPVVYAAASAFIGILGALITSSNTASNVLFAPLQATAARVLGVDVELAVAGQSAGGALGNSLAPGDALLGSTIAGIPGRLGEILGRALPWVVVTGALVSAAVVGIYLVL